MKKATPSVYARRRMDAIDVEALARADINLLVAFEALMQERSVTRAAKRLALSQSAMSHTLSRLRELIGDELFVRSGREMQPTPRAVAMIEPVRAALREIGAVLQPTLPFRPAEVRATVTIRAFDFAQFELLPRLAAILAERAPGVCLVARPYEADAARALADGSADLVIGLLRERQDPHHRVLSTEGFACAVRTGHPCLTEPLTPERFAALSHVVVSPVGRPAGFVDAALGDLELVRHVGFVAPQLFSAAVAAAQSDMILTAAERHLRVLARTLPLTLLEPPVSLPSFDVAMTWHERRSGDALHRFIREAVIEASASATAAPP